MDSVSLKREIFFFFLMRSHVIVGAELYIVVLLKAYGPYEKSVSNYFYKKSILFVC